MTKLKTDPKLDLEAWIDEVTNLYPPKVAKKRRKHMSVCRQEDCDQPLEANVRTVPGIITQRGCCYAGCKGVVIGPYGNMVHIVHGPVGCSFYAWRTRRNFYSPRSEEDENYIHYCFTTDLQDQDIIFGGEKKLRNAVQEAVDIFQPRAITIHSTCAVGLIGDDIQTVAREMSEQTGVQVVAFNCEGYKGVSQSAGHHIANNKLATDFVGTLDEEVTSPAVNIMGEYNIGGDAWEIERVLHKCGINVVATFSGDGHYDEMRRAHNADLNLVMCHRSINYIAEMMDTKYGIPWQKVNFIGIRAMSKSLRKIAAYFRDEALTQRIEEVIAEEEAVAYAGIAKHRERLSGKKVMLFVGGSRAHHYQELFRDLEMEPVVAGHEFAHRDDYEGRDVLPYIKVDADNKNIEEVSVQPDPERYMPRVDEEYRQRLEQEGLLNYYQGMLPDMEQGSLVIDDISHVEMEYLISEMSPDLVCGGIKDKYVIEKFGVPSKQLHNYDYSGPFAGYRGAINFAREIDMMVHYPAWKLLQPPWKSQPGLHAEVNVKQDK